MCQRPITQDGNTFACRSCDDCIALRRSGWIDRAMMELSTSPHASVWTLTYNEDTQENRDAARMFAYADVAAWLKRLRIEMHRKYPKEKTWVRFLCAGEQGDRKNRCHWHVVLFSSHEVQTVGEFAGFKSGQRGKGPLKWPEDRPDMLTIRKGAGYEKRLDWDVWGNGFVTLQMASEAAMHYVLSYALKDQFTQEKSHGTRREAKSETFATGLFRMSKRPAIGELFLFKRLADLAERGQCLPSLNLKVPNVAGYYHPSGRMREQMLWGLVALNKRVLYDTGRNAAQWSTLVQSVSDNQPDLEVLLGPQTEHSDDVETDETIFAKRGRDFIERRKIAAAIDRCGGAVPCYSCLNGLGDQALFDLGLTREYGTRKDGTGYAWYTAREGFRSYEERRNDKSGGLNPFCGRRGSKDIARAFPASGSRDRHG